MEALLNGPLIKAITRIPLRRAISMLGMQVPTAEMNQRIIVDLVSTPINFYL